MEYNDINISNVEEIIRKTVEEKVNELLKIEIDSYMSENPGIKNGHYKRKLKTKNGELKLNVPRDREAVYHSALINTDSLKVDDLIVSMYANGVSTRRISLIIEDIFGSKYSSSTVSKITDATVEEINNFNTRSIDKRYIAVLLDGLFFFLRRDKRVGKEPVIFALGIKETGEYEILGFYLTVKESHNNYEDVLEDLYQRGLREPLIFIADGLKNLDEAVMKYYPSADFQLCTVHYLRGIKSKINDKDIGIIEDANRMFNCSSGDEAVDKFYEFKNKWKNKYPAIVNNTELKTKELFAFYNYPAQIRRSLKSSNSIERMNLEIRRRIKVIPSITDSDAAMKLFYYKSVEFNSKHCNRKLNGYYKCKDEIRKIFNERYGL